MKGLWLTVDSLCNYLQTLDNLITLKRLDEEGYKLPSDFTFVASTWGDHLMEFALATIFECTPVERSLTRKTSNGSYETPELVLPLDGYEDWWRLRDKYPEAKELEEDMSSLEFDCIYGGSGISIRFDQDGMIVEDVSDTTYCHPIMDDLFTLKRMWIESLNFWRGKELQDGSNERRMENCDSEAAHEVSQCA
ncbi:hypothetical protein [Cohnella sp. AR92]|uniref:hypothetical protein n=1 Tax=Cohnella sp. AR92 TaxID=648716 RepID=UPI000F8D030A|nr:hypothetical protein [Cohnella sp. AR92]RUS44916.1 hypothetical protein ELR57_21915 [Cohnella sp. AR92]